MNQHDELTIDYAQSDEECLEVHGFLCVVARPHLMAPIDAKDSIIGVMDCRNNGIIINARLNGHLIGTLGLIPMNYWFNTKAKFFGNRWFFILPQFKFQGVGVRLEAEAAAFGYEAGVPVCLASHAKRRRSAGKTEPFLVRERELEPVELPQETADVLRQHDDRYH